MPLIEQEARSSTTLPFQIPLPVTVIMGDPRLSDPIKRGGKFNPDDLETISKLKKALKSIKDFHFYYIDDHKTLVSQLMNDPSQLVFNLCDEGFKNQAHKELHIPALLEILNIPYTGSGPACLALCYNKTALRAIAQSLSIPVPFEILYYIGKKNVSMPYFPAIIKPNFGDGSVAISQHAVVSNDFMLKKRVIALSQQLKGQPLLIQEYLEGAEYSVGLIGNGTEIEALPILEVDYSSLPPTLPHILSYSAKWDPQSLYWDKINYRVALISDKIAHNLIEMSKVLFERCNCKDYARFDFRTDANGIIKLLEVNPNPGWCWDGKFNLMAHWASLSYQELLYKIIHAAKKRYGL